MLQYMPRQTQSTLSCSYTNSTDVTGITIPSSTVSSSSSDDNKKAGDYHVLDIILPLFFFNCGASEEVEEVIFFNILNESTD